MFREIAQDVAGGYVSVQTRVFWGLPFEFNNKGQASRC